LQKLLSPSVHGLALLFLLDILCLHVSLPWSDSAVLPRLPAALCLCWDCSTPPQGQPSGMQMLQPGCCSGSTTTSRGHSSYNVGSTNASHFLLLYSPQHTDWGSQQRPACMPCTCGCMYCMDVLLTPHGFHHQTSITYILQLNHIFLKP
jgi:hypothetical protein